MMWLRLRLRLLRFDMYVFADVVGAVLFACCVCCWR